MPVQFAKPLGQMTRDELYAEAQKIQTLLAEHTGVLQTIYVQLGTTVRRSKVDEETQAYVSFANAGKRIAGLMSQGLRRAGAYERALASAKEDVAERTRRTKEAEDKRTQRKGKKTRELEAQSKWNIFDIFLNDPYSELELSMTPITEDLDELFGDEY